MPCSSCNKNRNAVSHREEPPRKTMEVIKRKKNKSKKDKKDKKKKKDKKNKH
jgi:hypothetical protein